MRRVVWINKSPWLKPGPIVYMGLLNAMSFARQDIPTDYFVSGSDDTDCDSDLLNFYSLAPHPRLHIHRIANIGRWRRSVYSKALTKIEEYCRGGDEVLVLTRELGGLSLLLKLKKKFPLLKVLYESHDFYVTIKHLESKRHSLSSMRRQWAERRLLPRADGMICITEHQRALYQQWFPNLAMIALPLGCLDLEQRGDFEQRRLKRRIAYIGHLHDYKGLNLFFELAQQLRDIGAALYCYGGSAAQVASLQEQVEKRGLQTVLQFRSFVSPKALHDILDSEISLGLVPLQDTFYNRYLTCPVKALDFIAHGLPTLASDLPSIHEVLGWSGHYCDGGSVSRFVEKAGLLLDDPQRYVLASQESYRRAAELTWSLRAQRILDFVFKG